MQPSVNEGRFSFPFEHFEICMVGWTILRSKYNSILASIMSVTKQWNGMNNKKRFDPFFHAKMTLWGNPTLKIGKMMII